MPVGIEEWRAGIAKCALIFLSNVYKPIVCFSLFLSSLHACIYLYLFILVALISIPVSLFLYSSYLLLDNVLEVISVDMRSPATLFDPFGLARKAVSCIFFPSRSVFQVLSMLSSLFFATWHRRLRKGHNVIKYVLYVLLLSSYLEIIYQGIDDILLSCGDIELNPVPNIDKCLKFFDWNSNSICARGCIKIPLIEAYNALHRFDIMAFSELMLDKSVNDSDILIEGFSHEIFRSDHPSNTKVGGVCIYVREGLQVKRRTDLELLLETVVIEVIIAGKKCFLLLIIVVPLKIAINLKLTSIGFNRCST